MTYYSGSNDETMLGKVCCSEYPSTIFDTAKSLGSTQGFFCGHDHYNNMSLEYQGIRLTYGMSIDYLVMPGIARETAQRGGIYAARSVGYRHGDEIDPRFRYPELI